MIPGTVFGRRKECADFLKFVGCSLEDLRWHLERQFKHYMTWRSHGDWQIDHIEPCAMFDQEDEDEVMECNHWTNLRPLFSEDNCTRPAIYTGDTRAPYYIFRNANPRDTIVDDRGLVSMRQLDRVDRVDNKPRETLTEK